MKTKIIKLILLCGLFLTGLCARAQSTDSAQIKEAALNYVEGYYNKDVARVMKGLSPELVKRIIVKDPNGDAIQTMGLSYLALITSKNTNANVLNPDQPLHSVVTIYDIGINIAAAKVVTNKFKFVDYLQLGKVNGEWKVINVLWELRGNRYIEIDHSVRRLFTGFAIAAFIAWKLIVPKAIATAERPATPKIHQLTGVR